MRNVSSRPRESSGSKISCLQDKGPNYAAARNKKPTRGQPIPIPQNPTFDYPNRVTARMNCKDGSKPNHLNNSTSRRSRATVATKEKNTKENNVNQRPIPTRKSDRVSARKTDDVIEIIDEDDEANALSPPPPVIRKRRMIQRDDSSSNSSQNESDSDNEGSEDNAGKRVAKKLRNDRKQRAQEEKDRKEREEDDRRAKSSTIPSRKVDFHYSEPTMSSVKRKDFSTLSSIVAKKIATAVNIDTGRKLSPDVSASSSSSPEHISSYSPIPPPPTRKTPPSPLNDINRQKAPTTPKSYIDSMKDNSLKDDNRSYIDRQKDTMKAHLQKTLGSNEVEEPTIEKSPKKSSRGSIKPRNPFKESQNSTNTRPSLSQSISKISSVFQLPAVLQSNSKTEPLPINNKKPIADSEEELSEYEDALSEPVEHKPVELPKLADDPIDHIPVKPIGVDKHILTYPFGGKKSVTLHERDLDRLEEDQFLNDSLLDIFPKIWADQYPDASTHTFSSFFYTKLAGDGSSINYDQIERWTARINIFEKKLIIIPVAQNHHWYLVVVTNPGLAIRNREEYGLRLGIDNDDQDQLKEEDTDVEGLASKPPSRPGRKAKSIKAGTKLDHKKPYIMILDALGGSKYETCKNTAEYLKKEAMNKLNVKEGDFIEPEFVYTDCPNQKNFVDCGVFCLHYMNSLYQDTERMMDVLYNNLKDDKGWDIDNTLPVFRLILKRILKKNILEYKKYLKRQLEGN